MGNANGAPKRELLGPDHEVWLLDALLRLVQVASTMQAQNWPPAGHGIRDGVLDGAMHATAIEVAHICGREPELVNIRPLPKPRSSVARIGGAGEGGVNG